MELINKEDAVVLIKAEMDKIRTHSLVDGTARINLRLAKNIIEDMPTIDIVRCKECRHREKYPCNDIEFYECSHLRLHGTKVGVEDDWFCADGEREGE